MAQASWRIFLLLLLIGLLAHTFSRYQLVTLVSLPLLVSLVTTWYLPRPARFLLILTLIAELFSLSPPGMATLVVWLPLLLWQVRGHITADLSFSFLAIAAVTTILQLMVLVGVDFIPSLSWTTWSRLPWKFLGLASMTHTIAAVLTILLFDYWLPVHQSSTSAPNSVQSYVRS